MPTRSRVPSLEWTDPETEAEETEEDWYSAMERAASFDRGEMLSILKPDPAKDDFEVLYSAADSVEVMKYLVRIQPPACSGSVET